MAKYLDITLKWFWGGERALGETVAVYGAGLLLPRGSVLVWNSPCCLLVSLLLAGAAG